MTQRAVTTCPLLVPSFSNQMIAGVWLPRATFRFHARPLKYPPVLELRLVCFLQLADANSTPRRQHAGCGCYCCSGGGGEGGHL